MLKKKQLVIAGIVGTMVVVDLIKFFAVGGTTIINWHSFIHPFWVVLSVVFLLIADFVDRAKLWRMLFGLYFIIFLASYLNQYFGFSGTLSYYCMLFNAIFAVAFYLSGRK